MKERPRTPPLDVEGDGAAIVSQDHVRAAGRRRLSDVDESGGAFLNAEQRERHRAPLERERGVSASVGAVRRGPRAACSPT